MHESTNYRGGPVVHVNDASRAVGVASALLSPDKREAYAAEIRADTAKISAAHFRAQADKKRLSLRDARANAVKIDFAKTKPADRPSSAPGVLTPTISPSSPPISIGRRSSRPGSWPGATPPSSATPRSARPRVRSMTMRKPCSSASSPRNGSPPAPPSASGRRMRSATTSCSMPMRAAPRDRDPAHPAPAARQREGRSTWRCRISSRL